MNTEKPNSGVCRNVFKNGGEKPTKAQVTQKWIELINRLEQGKAAGFPQGE